MKWVIYMLLLTAALWFPSRGTDVGKLIPVEVIAVSENGGYVRVETDTGDHGEGASLAAAFADLESTAPGVIYLDTAEYLILAHGMEGQIDTLREYLKGDVYLCFVKEMTPLEGAADYLAAHKPDARLDRPGQIPWLLEEDGRYLLIRK